MNKDWINWFLLNTLARDFVTKKTKHCHYEYCNLYKDKVPFHDEFKNFLTKYIGDTKFYYDVYHIHKWKVGNYFSEHTDNRANRRFAYVHELKESECKTKLLVEGVSLDFGLFDVHTLHSVPKIKKGERISLTVFGKNKKEKVII